MLTKKMKQPLPPLAPPEHIAIIMDGNGRWAQQRNMPRIMGHKAGISAMLRVIKAADEQGIKYLTLYGFSSENWKRPEKEVNDLMGLLKFFVRRELAGLIRDNVNIRVIGGRDDLSKTIYGLLIEAENATAGNTGLNLIIAFNYGGRGEVARAVQRIAHRIKAGELDSRDINEDLITDHLDTAGVPDPDLIIRTSGEERLSNFLTWQSAYSELLFVDTYWPDFSDKHLQNAISEFHNRDRRFGGLNAKAAV